MGISQAQFKEYLEAVVIALILSFLIITFIVQAFYIPSGSMKPTLKPGDRIFVNKFIYRFHSPERGDVIVFSPHGAPRKKYIKRVIGLPGDTVYIRDYKTYINGTPLKEEYINERMLGEFGPYQVPKNTVFVLGDNRNHSADSRFPGLVGYVDYKSISGKAFWVYWPLTRMRIIKHHDYEELGDNSG